MGWLWRLLTKKRGVSLHRWHGAGRTRRSEGGIALLMVVTSLMLMTVLVTELNYAARVRLSMAAHTRDEAQAYHLAHTGFNLYRLILIANNELAKNSSIQSAASMMGVNMGDALWQYVPMISTGLMRMLLGTGGDVDTGMLEEYAQTGELDDEIVEKSREESGGLFDDKAFLDFDGDFSAQVTDEDSKVNLAQLSKITSEEDLLNLEENLIALQVYSLMSGEEQDQWFYERSIERWEIIANLIDWMDSDTERAWRSGGYEDSLYDDIEPPYLTKNAGFDSKQEIRLVAGWDDEVYERFEDQLTIYGSGKVNINTASDEVMCAMLKAFSETVFTDQQCELVLDQLIEYKTLSSFSEASSFVSWLETNASYAPKQNMKNYLTTKSEVFTITSTGQVGQTMRTITAVLDFSSKSHGKIVYWRVD